MRSGALVPTTSGSDTVVSPVLRAPSSSLSAALVKKMNVLWGLDVPFYIAHNTGLHLGNYARNDGNGGDGKAVQAFPRPTIDQIMAWSPSFYSNLSGIRERAMVMSGRPVSWNYSDPAMTSSAIQNVRGYSSSQELFNKIFVPPRRGPAPRAPIVDKVLANYNRLRQSNRRLSAADKQRLDDHVARIAELQRKLTITVSGASCSSVTTPTDNANKHNANTPEDAGKQLQLWNEVAAAAFMCGTSRIGVLAYGDTSRFVSYGGDWHQEVAHQWQLADRQALLVQSYQRFFASTFVDMARRLDSVEEAPGLTYLDHSLLVWTQESGMETHGSVSIPVVTFGSAAGRMKTGHAGRLPAHGEYGLAVRSGRGRQADAGHAVQPVAGDRAAGDGRAAERIRALGHQGLRLSRTSPRRAGRRRSGSTTATRRRATSRRPATGCRSSRRRRRCLVVRPIPSGASMLRIADEDVTTWARSGFGMRRG